MTTVVTYDENTTLELIIGMKLIMIICSYYKPTGEIHDDNDPL